MSGKNVDIETKAAAVNAYNDGMSSTQIAALFGVAPSTVLSWVRNAGHPTRARGNSGTDADTRAAAVRDYLTGTAARAVAETHGVSHQSVLTWVKEAGHPVRSRPTAPTGARPVSPVFDAAVRDYLNGMSSTQVAAAYGVTPQTVCRWVRAAGHQARTTQPPRD